MCFHASCLWNERTDTICFSSARSTRVGDDEPLEETDTIFCSSAHRTRIGDLDDEPLWAVDSLEDDVDDKALEDTEDDFESDEGARVTVSHCNEIG